MSYEKLEWDSGFFDVPIGRIRDGWADGDAFAAAVGAADDDGIDCLYLLVPVGDDRMVELAIDAGFRPYDIQIELDRPLDRGVQSPPAVRDARLEDSASLERIARYRFHGTRFWSDPRFSRERARELYVAWLRRGMSTAPDRRTLVVGEAEGFVICRFDGLAGIGTIELIAVAGCVAGRGLGGTLVSAADGEFAAAGLDCARVVTQGRNVIAQRLYQRHGYRTRRVSVWLHRWRASGKPAA